MEKLSSEHLYQILVSCERLPFKYVVDGIDCIAILVEDTVLDTAFIISEKALDEYYEDDEEFAWWVHNELVRLLRSAKFDMLCGALVMYFPEMKCPEDNSDDDDCCDCEYCK